MSLALLLAATKGLIRDLRHSLKIPIIDSNGTITPTAARAFLNFRSAMLSPGSLARYSLAIDSTSGKLSFKMSARLAVLPEKPRPSAPLNISDLLPTCPKREVVRQGRKNLATGSVLNPSCAS